MNEPEHFLVCLLHTFFVYLIFFGILFVICWFYKQAVCFVLSSALRNWVWPVLAGWPASPELHVREMLFSCRKWVHIWYFPHWLWTCATTGYVVGKYFLQSVGLLFTVLIVSLDVQWILDWCISILVFLSFFSFITQETLSTFNTAKQSFSSLEFYRASYFILFFWVMPVFILEQGYTKLLNFPG